MQTKELETKILAIIAEQLGTDQIDLAADLQKDYDVDSIGVLDFIMTVEETFGVEFHDEDLSTMKSVNDVVAKVQELQKASRG